MEEEKGGSSSSSSPTSSRWNPAKEQIAILENLYRQGIRTPSTEQIGEITGKLREFGSIEGKNVFYWFQNHKARQRQKHNNFTYFSRLLRSPPTLLSPPLPPPPNGIYRPACLPAPQVGGAAFYQAQVPSMFLHGAVNRREVQEQQRREISRERNLEEQSNMSSENAHIRRPGETLQLFPLHPTGILDERPASSVTDAESVEDCKDEEEEEGEGCANLPFFNFLGAPKD